ncbi:MAG: hypothetical protein RSG52_03455 [Terrisporobacter sp.]|uniref:hypothetical protein n=1 Tax=Terrisporobacter sp. TaxID=1965305 RepID=UPI002FCA8F57
MKKGIIAISLLLTGALLVTPLANAITERDVQEDSKPVKVEQTTTIKKEEASNEANDKTTQTEENNTPVKEEEIVVKNEEPVKEEVKTETTEILNETVVNKDKEEVVQESGMSKSDAEAVLNKYLTDVENVDLTYTYQGDENKFEAMQEKGIKGYVFLPNVETDMAYLVDKDNGSIYFFHPSGYFELLQ